MTDREEIIEFEVGAKFIKNGIAKFIYLQENFPEEKLSPHEVMKLYSCVYNMCIQNYPHSYDSELYNLYKEIIEEYVKGTVLSSLREKHDEFFLLELIKRWKNHKILVRLMSSQIFQYLNRYHIGRLPWEPSLDKFGFTCFYDAVSQDINMKARDIVISLIEKEREGAQIDKVLLKNVTDYFVEIGAGWDHYFLEAGPGFYYQKQYEEVILNSTVSYYLGKAMSWISEEDYIEKAKECLKREEENVSHYLAFVSKDKLLATVQQQLLSVYEKHQLDKDKVEELSRNLSSLLV
ncbi:hypothetical protein AQUCO_00900641v1 [Aquilegia coerulea]|uniref:Cullin N-terminal domain-containing protein n=1 Tax=Aquilegia coerulea TaxID=218851 RepID=A0A2G5EEP8_AQUCA|nr:hypothetical protein AQUCO_00900641v1 [Aquilegia coerulea]